VNEQETEDYVRLTHAPKLFPGEPPSIGTLYRWVNIGVRNGVKLECVRRGNTAYVTRAMIDRFLENCNNSKPAPTRVQGAAKAVEIKDKKRAERAAAATARLKAKNW
jgi:hypothetical protein